MKKVLIFAAVAALALVGCQKKEYVFTKTSGEMSFAPMYIDKAVGSRGYVEGEVFEETYLANLHGTGDKVARQMQISAYLYPQNGEQKNYFVDKTYAASDESDLTKPWWNVKPTTGDHDPIYWPVGGTMDFLAYSLSSETEGAGKSFNVSAVWDADNAASRVTLTVPGENTQNDILFASAYGIESVSGADPVDMTFNHAQAWIEFVLTGSVDEVNPDGIVTLKRIELENVYNAGKVAISNNKGNATAKWDFTGEEKQNIDVDNFNIDGKLNGIAKYLDMLIPQQTKTAFVIYYTLGSSPKELSYRFTTDQKTWLMGEKYVYNINITTSEVTVAPSVTKWNEVATEFSYKVCATANIDEGPGTPCGYVTINGEGPDEAGGNITTTEINSWGNQIELKAEAYGIPGYEPYWYRNLEYRFVKWSDGSTDNPRTINVTEDIDISAEFTLYEYYPIGYLLDYQQDGDGNNICEYEYPDKPAVDQPVVIKFNKTPGHDNYDFDHWETAIEDRPGEGDDNHITFNSPVAIGYLKAVFKRNDTYTVTVTLDGGYLNCTSWSESGGVVSEKTTEGSPRIYTCEVLKDHYIDLSCNTGSAQGEGYDFDRWIFGDSSESTDQPLNLLVDQNIALTATQGEYDIFNGYITMDEYEVVEGYFAFTDSEEGYKEYAINESNNFSFRIPVGHEITNGQLVFASGYDYTVDHIEIDDDTLYEPLEFTASRGWKTYVFYIKKN